ncbi:hypothetical protein IR010_04190 [Flavobacterium sp. MR2016-29]|uniref:hypothetical protein n=1 Tax=Flavobacterium sp. MR2016-29 TaxID=2783795 RepID=UPI00188AD135|nr:hypothetical protein [Flavobacterium sp. MR2016-29]MBF4491730.1 hypothetical protein [Flavobacterium sp. MR2016-29]
MKKILCLVSAILLVLNSCSSNDAQSIDKTSEVLLKKTIITGADNSFSEVKCLYDGNKIVSNTSNNENELRYIYTGTKITKLEFFEKGMLQSYIDYTYNNEKLVSKSNMLPNGEKISETEYTYFDNGNISYLESIKAGSQIVTVLGVYKFSNGNLLSSEKYENGVMTTGVYYEYDNKNNPSKNILGFNLLLDHDVSVNNVVKQTCISNSGVTTEFTNAYKYNAKDYPTEKIKSLVNRNAKETTQFFY